MYCVSFNTVLRFAGGIVSDAKHFHTAGEVRYVFTFGSFALCVQVPDVKISKKRQRLIEQMTGARPEQYMNVHL